MAPYAGPDRDEVLKRLRGWLAPRLPIALGDGHPTSVIDCADGTWTLRRLVTDVASRDAAYAKALATEPFFWMPEHAAAFLIPGPILASAPTRAALADTLEALPWPWR